MREARFRFVSRWRLAAPAGRVWATLVDLERLPRWWPDFRAVRLLDPGLPGAVGRAVDVELRGPLTVTFRLRLRIERAEPGRTVVVAASGDLEGRGTWELSPRGDETDAAFEWSVRLRRPVLAALEPVLGPLYRVSHDAVMRRGERGLGRELARAGPLYFADGAD